MREHKLQLKHLQNILKPWMLLKDKGQRYNNWFQIIRETLGINTRYLAQRMNVSQARAVQLQQAEVDGSITLRNLKKAAEALDCELVYAFVPNIPLEKIIENRAQEIAKQMMGSVSKNMSLEKQSTSSKELKDQYKNLVEELVLEEPKKLWRDYD